MSLFDGINIDEISFESESNKINIPMDTKDKSVTDKKDDIKSPIPDNDFHYINVSGSNKPDNSVPDKNTNDNNNRSITKEDNKLHKSVARAVPIGINAICNAIWNIPLEDYETDMIKAGAEMLLIKYPMLLENTVEGYCIFVLFVIIVRRVRIKKELKQQELKLVENK